MIQEHASAGWSQWCCIFRVCCVLVAETALFWTKLASIVCHNDCTCENCMHFCTTFLYVLTLWQWVTFLISRNNISASAIASLQLYESPSQMSYVKPNCCCLKVNFHVQNQVPDLTVIHKFLHLPQSTYPDDLVLVQHVSAWWCCNQALPLFVCPSKCKSSCMTHSAFIIWWNLHIAYTYSAHVSGIRTYISSYVALKTWCRLDKFLGLTHT